MKAFIINIGKFGISFYVRSFWKYKTFYIVPGFTLEYLNGAMQKQVDFELKILCFGIGIKLFKKK